MGFVTRTDIRRTEGFGQYTFRPTALGLRASWALSTRLVNRGFAIKGTWLVRF